MTRNSFTYGRERFDYKVSFTARNPRRIAIHVQADGSVEVDAPEGESPARIHRAVLKRARWIRGHVEDARRRRRHVLPRDYVSGECLFYLGRRYQLKVRKTEADDPGVKLLRGRICVSAPSGAAVVRTRLAEWYRRRAMEVFRQRLLDITERVGWRGEIPRWRLVSMRKQWGSCSPSGVILLNPHLVKAPRECVDYVICHELCHLKEHNHSPRYYRILRKVMPDWERVKARLDGMAEMLLNE